MSFHRFFRLDARVMSSLLLTLVSSAGAKEKLELTHQTLGLPGAPSIVLPADVDGDGLQDLVVAVAYTEWDQIDIDEWSEMRGVEGLVAVLTVVPTIMDRREIRIYFGTQSGGFDTTPATLPIDLTVLSLDHGPGDPAIIALTDTGISALRVERGDGEHTYLRLEPLIEQRPVFARSGSLLPNLNLSHDLSGDGKADLLLPATRGLTVVLAEDLAPGGPAKAPTELPGSRTRLRNGVERQYPLPQIRDVTGDGLPELLFPDRIWRWDRPQILRNQGDGHFAAAISPAGRDHRPEGLDLSESEKEPYHPIVYFGDLDGDGIGEYLTEESLEDEDAGWRKEVKEAKRPPRRYRVHRSHPDMTMEEEPFEEFQATGYAFDLSDSEIKLPAGFKDLDGDRRQDLITLTLDFSLFQAVKIMTTQRLSIGLDFHILCQDEAGRFKQVAESDLSGKFKIDLNNFQLGQLSQFAGDFDGDGRIDFLQIGRGRTVTIHRGQAGCKYPAAPDLTLKLDEPPLDLGLVRVLDVDADGRSDLLLTQPEQQPEVGVTAPVRLEVYTSRGAE